MKKLLFAICLLFSVALHLILFFSYDLYRYVFPYQQEKTTSQIRLKAILVKSGQRVDIVEMPRHTLQELKELEKTQKMAVSANRKREIFLRMLQDIAKREVESPEEKMARKARGDTKNVSEELEENLKVLIMAGNKLSRGMALVGDKRDEELSALYQYLETLPEHVQRKWKLPTYLKEKNLRCRIQVNISEEGELINYSIIQSSGVKAYDQAALKSVLDSSPYPKPDKSIAPLLIKGHLILGFPD